MVDKSSLGAALLLNKARRSPSDSVTLTASGKGFSLFNCFGEMIISTRMGRSLKHTCFSSSQLLRVMPQEERHSPFFCFRCFMTRTHPGEREKKNVWEINSDARYQLVQALHLTPIVANDE